MRNLTIALMFVLAAAVLAGCPTALQKATATINSVTLATQECEVAYKKLTATALDTIATTERDARTAALAKAACNLDPAGVQPTDACRTIVADAKAKYEARKGKVVGIATKLDASTGLVYAALLTAIDVLILVRDGQTGKWPQLTTLVAEAITVGQALLNAWADYKKNAASY